MVELLDALESGRSLTADLKPDTQPSTIATPPDREPNKEPDKGSGQALDLVTIIVGSQTEPLTGSLVVAGQVNLLEKTAEPLPKNGMTLRLPPSLTRWLEAKDGNKADNIRKALELVKEAEQTLQSQQTIKQES